MLDGGRCGVEEVGSGAEGGEGLLLGFVGGVVRGRGGGGMDSPRADH